MGKTNIGWCTHSWNLIKWFCTKISPGCRHCYMMTLAQRYPQHAAERPVLREAAWKELRQFPTGAEIFAGDMYDLFHEQMPMDIIRQHFQAAASRPDCTFLFLTKRVERARELAPLLTWHPNIYMGVSVENAKYAWRIDALKDIPAAGKYISFEPLLDSVGAVDLRGIDGAITGGESGAGFRPFNPAWALDIRDSCQRDGVAFFHKQGSGLYPGMNRELDGRTYDDLAWRKPAPALVQEGLFA